MDNDRYLEAVCHIREHHLEQRITIHHHDALTFDTQLLQHAPYDCLFIDAAKAQYQKFFEKYVPFVKEDGIIVVDNLDFMGWFLILIILKIEIQDNLLKKSKDLKIGFFNMRIMMLNTMLLEMAYVLFKERIKNEVNIIIKS